MFSETVFEASRYLELLWYKGMWLPHNCDEPPSILVIEEESKLREGGLYRAADTFQRLTTTLVAARTRGRLRLWSTETHRDD